MIDVPPGPHRSTWAKAKVEVRELMDGRVRIVREGQVIATQDPPPDFTRLMPRKNNGLTEAGQLPVAMLKQGCAQCTARKDGLKRAG